MRLGTHAETAVFRELLMNATSGSGSIEAIKLASENDRNGKVLLDISNPLDFSKGMPPSLTISNTDSLGELVQRTFPELHVVKGFNTLAAPLMVNPGILPEHTDTFICGNDAERRSRCAI